MIREFKRIMIKEFEMTNLGFMKYFLTLEVKQSETTFLCSKKDRYWKSTRWQVVIWFQHQWNWIQSFQSSQLYSFIIMSGKSEQKYSHKMTCSQYYKRSNNIIIQVPYTPKRLTKLWWIPTSFLLFPSSYYLMWNFDECPFGNQQTLISNKHLNEFQTLDLRMWLSWIHVVHASAS